MPLKNKLIVGNWKMNKSIAEAVLFIEKLSTTLKEKDSKIFLAVPFTALAKVADVSKGSTLIIGAQNINEHPSGAYTGEISASMVKEAGAQFVIVGHSERRQIFHESSPVVHEKVKQALAEGLQPLVCVGESLEEYKKGETESVLTEQITSALEGITIMDLEKITLAYEPVWAIGTGLAAPVELISTVHIFCRKVIASLFGHEASLQVNILYGGSVSGSNSAELLQNENIDGVLVGSASLTVDSFSKIINSHNSNSQSQNNCSCSS